MRSVYSLVLAVLLPFVLLYFLWRSRREPGYRQRWAERFGAGPAVSPGGIWLHAASVGEVQAAQPLVDKLLTQYSQLPLVFTCGTPSGSQRIQELWGSRLTHQYLPFDLPGIARRFLDRIQPRLALLMETEIWPNLYRACRPRGIPLLIISARLTEKSLQRFQKFPGAALLRDTLACTTAVLTQTDADRARYERAGATRVEVAGNLKFDYLVDPSALPRAQVLREGWGAARPVWIAASTHEGEESVALAAHARLRQQIPELLLVLVPRHSHRFARVSELCDASGFPTARRSRGETGTPATVVLLVDTLGELNLFYAAADLAFVGGSLVPVGGHNLLEPAALGLPILTGPHMHTQAQMTELLLAAGGAQTVSNSDEIVAAAIQFLGSAEAHRQAGAAARQVVEQNRGALARVMEQVALCLASSKVPPA